MKDIRKIYIGLIAAVCVSGFVSCRDLDEYNPSGATADAAWSTPQGFVTVVNAAYSEQRNWYGKEDGIFMGETGTDLWYNREKNTYARQLTQYDGLNSLQGNPVRSTWTYLWRGVNLCNAGINRIGDAGFTNEAEKNKREGELRFLRAFYYWHIVETWGGVMLRTTETTEPELTATRSSVEEFYNLIISDLEFAAEHLPMPQEWGAEYSRASKKSALGFLARASLSRAYHALAAGNSGDATTYFTRARDVANEVIAKRTDFGVELWDNPASLWTPVRNKEPNKEALYTVSISTNIGLNIEDNPNRVFMTFQTPYVGDRKPALQYGLEYGYDNERRLMPTLTLLNYFDESKDARYAASFQEVWLANSEAPYVWNEVTARSFGKNASVIGQVIRPQVDTALFITKRRITNEASRPYVVIDRDSIYAANGSIRTGTRDFVTLRKFMDPHRDTPASKVGTRDIIVMRLAEMYMIAAEAEFKLGNPTEAAELINVIRRRAALPGREADMLITAADISDDFILEERAREFCGEYMRWFDVKRIKYNGTEFVNFIKERNPDITQVQGFHRLRPIRQEELNALLNREEFGQNPGY